MCHQHANFQCCCMFTVSSSIQPIEDEVIIEGGNVTLFCNASGMPSPTVSWIKVSSSQRTSGSQLNFTNISRNEAGEYRCEASNLCGNDSESATVDVQCKLSVNAKQVQVQASPGQSSLGHLRF